jgi:hypothetical protein
MVYIKTLLGLVDSHATWVLLVVSAVTLCLLVLNICFIFKMRKLSRMMKTAASMGAESSGELGYEFGRRLSSAEDGVGKLDERQKSLRAQLAQTVQKVGLVRFDAFPDVGGEQSFALALLDENSDGVALSNIFGRSESRIYAKLVTGGQSKHTLSDEEKAAIRRAVDPSK